MEFTLSMTFLTSTGEKATMSVSDVKENLTQEEAVALMDAIIANDIFETSIKSSVRIFSFLDFFSKISIYLLIWMISIICYIDQI